MWDGWDLKKNMPNATAAMSAKEAITITVISIDELLSLGRLSSVGGD